MPKSASIPNALSSGVKASPQSLFCITNSLLVSGNKAENDLTWAKVFLKDYDQFLISTSTFSTFKFYLLRCVFLSIVVK
ncbi:hypothetical protein HZB97_03585 [Candidatus Gottesmanbacteria bacterium]|nr:hypothetical protein [Candidatus Gottesmanbacteria bacterium]